MVPSEGVQLPQRHSWLSTQRMAAGRGRPYRSASASARAARSMASVAARRSIRRTISATHRSSSATVMPAGIDTRSTPPTSPRLDRLAPPGAANDLDPHSSGRYRDAGTSDGGCDGPLARRPPPTASSSRAGRPDARGKDRPPCADPRVASQVPDAVLGLAGGAGPGPAPPRHGRRPASGPAPRPAVCATRWPAATTRASKWVRLSPPGGANRSSPANRAVAPGQRDSICCVGAGPTIRRRRIPAGRARSSAGPARPRPRPCSSAVRRARARSELTTRSKGPLPLPQQAAAARCVCRSPPAESGGSAHPCQRPVAFHTDWAWRSSSRPGTGRTLVAGVHGRRRPPHQARTVGLRSEKRDRMNLAGRTRPRSRRAAPQSDAETPASVVLLLFAAARVAAGTGREPVQGAPWPTCSKRPGARHGERFAAVLDDVRVWVNGEPAPPDLALRDGDEVAVLPPVLGRGRLIAATPTPAPTRPGRPAARGPCRPPAGPGAAGAAPVATSTRASGRTEPAVPTPGRGRGGPGIGPAWPRPCSWAWCGRRSWWRAQKPGSGHGGAGDARGAGGGPVRRPGGHR